MLGNTSLTHNVCLGERILIEWRSRMEVKYSGFEVSVVKVLQAGFVHLAKILTLHRGTRVSHSMWLTKSDGLCDVWLKRLLSLVSLRRKALTLTPHTDPVQCSCNNGCNASCRSFVIVFFLLKKTPNRHWYKIKCILMCFLMKIFSLFLHVSLF